MQNTTCTCTCTVRTFFYEPCYINIFVKCTRWYLIHVIILVYYVRLKHSVWLYLGPFFSSGSLMRFCFCSDLLRLANLMTSSLRYSAVSLSGSRWGRTRSSTCFNTASAWESDSNPCSTEKSASWNISFETKGPMSYIQYMYRRRKLTNKTIHKEKVSSYLSIA